MKYSTFHFHIKMSRATKNRPVGKILIFMHGECHFHAWKFHATMFHTETSRTSVLFVSLSAIYLHGDDVEIWPGRTAVNNAKDHSADSQGVIVRCDGRCCRNALSTQWLLNYHL